MGRVKGSINKNSTIRPSTTTLSSAERIQLLANLIIDRILEDQRSGQPLLKKLKVN